MKYTVFIREPDNTGTTYITSFDAETPEDAAKLAREDCAENWEWDELEKGELHVLGIATGDVNIVEWDDLI